MMKPRVLTTAVILALLFTVLDIFAIQAVPQDDPGFCPSGYKLLARYEWDGDKEYLGEPESTGNFTFDSGEEMVFFTPNASGEGPNAQVGAWHSINQVDAFVLVSGNKNGARVTYVSYLPEGGYSAEYHYETVVNKDISHIDYCTLILKHKLFLPNILGVYDPNSANEF